MRSLPWALAWTRLRRNLLGTLASSIAVTFALLALLSLHGISHSTNNSLVSYSLAKLNPGDRSLTLTSNKIHSTPEHVGLIDNYLAKRLTGISAGPLTRELLYHEISDRHGVGFYFGGVDRLAKSVRITSGRLPLRCNRTLCEVIQIGGQKDLPPRPDYLGLKIVGTGNIQDSQLFTGTMALSSGVPILIADGIAQASALPHFQNLQGAMAWVGPLNMNNIESGGAAAFINSILAFENQLSIERPEVTLNWPQDALSQAGDQVQSISINFVLLNFVVVAVLIAFLILFSRRRRAEHGKFRAGLSRIGTPQKTLSVELVVEYGAPLILGLLLTLPFSLALPGILSLVHFHSDLNYIYEGWPNYLLLILASIGLLVGSSIIGDRAWRKRIWIPYCLGSLFLLTYISQSTSHDMRSRILSFPFAIFSR